MPKEAEQATEVESEEQAEITEDKTEAPAKEATQEKSKGDLSLLDEAVEKEGKPDFIPDDAWDVEKNEIKADVLQDEFRKANKRITDLRKKLGKKGSVPKDVESYKNPEFEVGSAQAKMLEDDSGLVPVFREAALKHGLSQDQFEGVIQDTLGWLAENQEKIIEGNNLSDEQKQAYFDEEISKLGTNGNRLINTIAGWKNGLEKEGYLSESDVKTIGWWTSNADGIKLLNKLRVRMGGEEIPMESAVSEGLPSDVEIAKMIGSQEYKDDQAFRNKVEHLLDLRKKTGRPVLLQTG